MKTNNDGPINRDIPILSSCQHTQPLSNTGCQTDQWGKLAKAQLLLLKSTGIFSVSADACPCVSVPMVSLLGIMPFGWFREYSRLRDRCHISICTICIRTPIKLLLALCQLAALTVSYHSSTSLLNNYSTVASNSFTALLDFLESLFTGV